MVLCPVLIKSGSRKFYQTGFIKFIYYIIFVILIL